MATSSPRANTSPRSWFLPSSHPQPNPSAEDLCPLLGPEPPPRRPSYPSTASALAPATLVPAFRHHCSMLGYSVHIVSCGLPTAQPRASGKGKKITTIAGKSSPTSRFSPKRRLTLPGEVQAPWMEQVPTHPPAQGSSSAWRKRRRKPFPTPTPWQLRTVQAPRPPLVTSLQG